MPGVMCKLKSKKASSSLRFKGSSPIITGNSFINCEINIMEDWLGGYADDPNRPTISHNQISMADIGVICRDNTVLHFDNNTIVECNIGLISEGNTNISPADK